MTTPTMSTTDVIEEQVTVPQSRSRVWRALTNAKELGTWFGMDLGDAAITPGAHVTGRVTVPGYEHIPADLMIDEVVPESRFSWRWHPNAIDPSYDYSADPRTLVTFTLDDAPNGGTVVRVTESGFDALPEARRAKAFAGNTNGWRGQLQKRLPGYLAQ